MKFSLLVLLFTVACGSESRSDAGSKAPPTPASLADTDWILSFINGKPPIAGSNVTLEFDTVGLGGYSGCNWYGARYSMQASSIRVDQVGGTARACTRPEGLMDQEMSLYRLLHGAREIAVDNDLLTFRDSASVVVLQFRQRVHLPMNPADLVGTNWVLASVNGTAFQSNPPVTLRFSTEGTSGFGGCREYTGTYRARGDEIRFTSTAMNSTECNRGLAVQRREDEFTTWMSETSHYRMTADSLFLFTYPGGTVVFLRGR